MNTHTHTHTQQDRSSWKASSFWTHSICLIKAASALDTKGSSLFLKCECIIYAEICAEICVLELFYCALKLIWLWIDENKYVNQKKNAWKHFCITEGGCYAALSHANTQIMKRQWFNRFKLGGGHKYSHWKYLSLKRWKYWTQRHAARHYPLAGPERLTTTWGHWHDAQIYLVE